MTEEFKECLDNFIKAAQQKVTAYYKSENLLEIMEGPKYIRVVSNPSGQRYVYCFIDKTNGNILKAASWKKPELKNPRSNILKDEDFGASGVDWHGAVYLR